MALEHSVARQQHDLKFSDSGTNIWVVLYSHAASASSTPLYHHNSTASGDVRVEDSKPTRVKSVTVKVDLPAC